MDFERSIKRKLYPATFTLPEAEIFQRWFMDRAGTSNVTTASRNVQFFIAALDFAVKSGRIKRHCMVHYQSERDPHREPVSLTSAELIKMIEASPLFPHQRRARDLFLFQCATGISYADLKHWERKKMDIGDVLAGRRAKNESPYMVPLDAAAEAILVKYSGKLPMLSLQAYNRMLKEIAQVAGIDKRLTTHIGRKTFATMKKESGWPVAAISSMLGHRSVKTTELHYLSTTFAHVEREFEIRKGQHDPTSLAVLKKVLRDRPGIWT